jgi:mono/diheme cytochrome c family protein
MNRSVTFLLFALAGVTCAVGLALAGDTGKVVVIEQSAPYVARSDGAGMYQAYCASCHGIDGAGRGVAAKALVTQPANLTALARANGGSFPQAHVRYVLLDARDVPEHAASDMPVWAEVFRAMDHESPGSAMLRASNLADYLETIQQP